MRHFINTIAFLFLGLVLGCSTAPGPVHMTEVECRLSSDCSPGEYCDSFTSLCGWDCRSDAECELGMYCATDRGRCLREEVPPPPPDTNPVLEITAGQMEDLTVLAGTADAELLRFTIVNRSTQPVWITELPVQIAPLTGFALTGVLGEVKVRNERTRVTVMGPMNLEGAMIDTSFTFVDAFSIMPGESVDLAVRVDLQAGASSEFDLVIGASDGTLGLNPIFADTSIGVGAELITNNVTLVRHVNVIGIEEMTVPGAVSVFMPESGGWSTIDAGVPYEVSIFHITAMNATESQVRLSDLRIRVTADDGRPWAEDTIVALASIDVYDARTGTFILAPPGASGCGGNGCTFIFDAITLNPGESTTLDVRVRMNLSGRRLFVGVGESFSVAGADPEPGAIFHRIEDAGSREALPMSEILGNQAGFHYLRSR